MEAEYEVISGSLWRSELKDIVLDPNENAESSGTRKVVRARIVNNADGSEKRVNFSLVHQKRHARKEPWKDVDAFSLSRLLSGEEARLSLDAEETAALVDVLKDLYAVSRAGEPSEERRAYIVRRGNEQAPVASVHAVIDFLRNGGEVVWDDIVAAKLNIPTALALHKVHSVRAAAVAEFEQHMNDGDWDEGNWQAFFGANQWIFGYGLAYQILDTVQEQVYYGGRTLTGKGGQRGDYLAATRAPIKFTVLVEIKRPDTALLKSVHYRNKVYNVSDELSGGVGQVQSNCRTWITQGSQQEDNREDLENADTYTYEPKGILVVGCTRELDDRDKRASFELYRRNLKNPEILTFDELLERAKFMVEHDDIMNVRETDAGDTPREP